MVPYKRVKAPNGDEWVEANDQQYSLSDWSICKATKDAGRIAGLDVQRIINGATAAALSYGLIFDINHLIFQSLEMSNVTDGDTFLCAEGFDNALLEILVSELKRTDAIDLSKAKIELSSTSQTKINLSFMAADDSGAKHLNKSLTNSKFESLVNRTIERTMTPVRDV
uniref:Uncharacterized protein n=1 Tax=Ananas comosus var. bracteatus TaxID=296719 RepID=A0A6V7PHW9_ANACO|nr:unnamed protein product [Ananas comosus var. bracteatus]